MPDSTTADPTRIALVEQVVAFAGHLSPDAVAVLREKLDEALDAEGRTGLARLIARLGTTGSDWAYFEKDPLARRIHDIVGDAVLGAATRFEGMEHLDRARGRAAVFFANHLSYADANTLQVLLDRSGYADIGDRLTVIVGPKVYSDPMRRFSSLCFGTVKMPQSSERASGEAVMSIKDTARFARSALRAVDERQKAGDILLVFVEGTRSRTATMQRALAAVARYIQDPAALLVPIGIAGSEKLFPVGDERVHAASVRVRIGPPGGAAELFSKSNGKRQLMMDAVGVAIAGLLPPEYRGVYGDPPTTFPDAATVAGAVFKS